MKTKSIRITVTTGLFVVACVLLSLISVLQYKNSSWNLIVEGHLGREQLPVMGNDLRMMLLVAFISLSISWLYYLFYQKHGKISVRCILPVVIMILMMLLWSTSSLKQYGMGILRLLSSPAVYIACAMAFHLGESEEINKIATRLCWTGGWIYLGMALMGVTKFYLSYGNVRMAQGSIITYYSCALFFFAILICENSDTNKNRLLFGIASGLLLLVGVLTLSRGWMLQGATLLIKYYIKYSKTESLNKKIINVISAITAGILVYSVLTRFFGNAMGAMLGRMSQDTRGSQLTQFFEEVPIYNLLIVQGMNVTYTLNGEQYAYIDNQIILMLFRYGLISTTAYLYPMLKILIHSVFSFKRQEEGIGMVVFMWIAALCGISIYFGNRLDILNIIVMTKVGHAYASIEKRQHISE